MGVVCFSPRLRAETGQEESKDRRSIRVRADHWFPFNGEPGSNEEGFAIEMMRHIFESAGYEVDYKLVPWKRALEDARNGEIDAVVGATANEAQGLVLPAESIGHTTTVFFTLRGHPWNYKGSDSLAEVRVTAILGYDYGESFAEYLRENRNNPELVDLMGGTNAFEKVLHKLERGLVDVIPENPVVFEARVKQLGRNPSDYRSAGEMPEKVEVFVAFSPKSQEVQKLVEMWDTGVERLRREGTLEKILNRHGLTDWTDKPVATHTPAAQPPRIAQ